MGVGLVLIFAGMNCPTQRKHARKGNPSVEEPWKTLSNLHNSIEKQLVDKN